MYLACGIGSNDSNGGIEVLTFVGEIGNGSGIDGQQQGVGGLKPASCHYLVIEIVQHVFVFAYLLGHVVVGSIDIETCADSTIDKVDNVKRLGVFVELVVDFLIFLVSDLACLVKEGVALFKGGSGEKKTPLFLMVIDVRFNGWNVRRSDNLRLNMLRQTEEDEQTQEPLRQK